MNHEQKRLDRIRQKMDEHSRRIKEGKGKRYIDGDSDIARKGTTIVHDVKMASSNP